MHPVRYQIKSAIIYDTVNGSSKTFDTGDVYLHEISNDYDYSLYGPPYVVGDDSGEFSDKLEIRPYNTVVTDDGITIIFSTTTVFILTLDGNNVALYQELLMPYYDFDVSIRIFQL